MLETVIVLAAGQGTRLRPLTDKVPKCMVELHGRPLLAWQLAALRAAGARKIVVVRGYCADAIALPGVTYVTNERYADTNMVCSLLCASEHFGDGFALAYSDIVYEPQLVRSLLATDAELALLVDRDWLRYWQARFPDPLDDAETLRLAGDRVTEIGQKPRSLSEIEAQFVGLVAFQRGGVERLRELGARAEDLQRRGLSLPGCARPLDKMYTTDLLQASIRDGCLPVAVPTDGGWLEIDSLSDHALAQRCSQEQDGILRIGRGAQRARE